MFYIWLLHAKSKQRIHNIHNIKQQDFTAMATKIKQIRSDKQNKSTRRALSSVEFNSTNLDGN